MKELPMRDTLAGVGVNYPSAWLLLFWGSVWQMLCQYGIPISSSEMKNQCGFVADVCLVVGGNPACTQGCPPQQCRQQTQRYQHNSSHTAWAGDTWVSLEGSQGGRTRSDMIKVVQFFWHVQDNKIKSTILPIPTSSTILLTPFLALIVQLLP